MHKNTSSLPTCILQAAQELTASISAGTTANHALLSYSTLLRAPDIDLVPLRQRPKPRQDVSVSSLLYDHEHTYHPRFWTEPHLQIVDDSLVPVMLVGPPNRPPLVCGEALHNLERMARWIRFGGRAPVKSFFTWSSWCQWNLTAGMYRTRTWPDTLRPGPSFRYTAEPCDLIKEHDLLGQWMLTLSVEHLNDLLPMYRHAEPLTLDLVLCQVWKDLGAAYRLHSLSSYSKLLYKAYVKLPALVELPRYTLTYHEDAPRYYT